MCDGTLVTVYLHGQHECEEGLVSFVQTAQSELPHLTGQVTQYVFYSLLGHRALCGSGTKVYNHGRQFNDRQISVANFQDEKKTLQQILKTLF